MTKRRKLAKRERSLLWYQGGGKCAICGDPLPAEGWHADHIIPFVVTGDTNVHETQALCLGCNLRKGDKVLRLHQRWILEICNEILSGQPIKEVVANVTPGGGKSGLPVILASKLIPFKADALCWVVPRISLRSQGEEAFIDPRFRGILGHKSLIRQSTNDIDPSRNLQGHITTYQAIAQDPMTILQDFRRKRYILFLDEPHHVYVGSPFERALRPLIEEAVLVVYASGTLERGDRRQIAFLPYRMTESGAAVDTEETRERRFIKYTRLMALGEEPPAIVPLEFEVSDSKAQWVDCEGNTQTTDSFYGEDVDTEAALRTVLETSFAFELLDKCVDHWQGHKLSVFRKAKLLVVAPGIDIAKTYYEYLRKKGVRCEIVHSREDDKTTQSKIDWFKKGGEALITVAIAYEGLDVPEITHIACLTHYRSKPWLWQCFARANRIVAGKGKGFVFAPDDPAFNAVIESLRLEQEAAARVMEEELQEPDPGNGGRNLNGIIPQESEMGETRVLGPNPGDGLTAEEYRLYSEAANSSGLPPGLSVSDLKQFVLNFLSSSQNGTSEPGANNGPLVTPTQEQNKLLNSIEAYARRVDVEYYGKQWGRTNKELFKIFDKSRSEMTIKQLRDVWSYLQRNYPDKRQR